MSDNRNEIVPAEQRLAGLRKLMMSEKVQNQIMAALPKSVDGVRMFRVYLTAVQKTPRILDCDPVSIIGAVMQSAQLGLSLDSVFGEGFLIPRRNKHTGGYVMQFQVGYKGLRRLALKADDSIRDIYSRVVYQNDRFDYSYEPKMLAHTPADSVGRGPLKFAYAKVIWKDGYDRFIVAGQPEIEKARQSSDSFKAGYGPWVDHEDAMWAKTALRRLADTLTLNSESDLAKALTAEDGDGRQALGLDLDMPMPVADDTVPTNGSALDRLAQQGASQGPPARRRRAGTVAPVTAAVTEPAPPPTPEAREPGQD